MTHVPLNKKPSRFYQIMFFICICMYFALGIKTELLFIEMKPIANSLLGDFRFYERALTDTIAGKDTYAVRVIGPGYLYPPPALFIVEAFHAIEPFHFKFLVYAIFNIALLILTVAGIAKYYGYSTKDIWYWYVLCLGFAPFLELLQVGQINMFTMFGIFLFFWMLEKSPILSGFGLSLAIFTKVSPVLLLAYLIPIKKFKVAAITMVWMLIILILCALRYGIHPILVYPEVFQWLSNQFPTGVNVHSLVSKLAMIFGKGFDEPDFQITQRILTLYLVLIMLTSGLFTMLGKQMKESLFIITVFGMTVLPNVLWYHHYVFILLPILVWMGWKTLDLRVVAWCFLGLIVIQVDRFYLTYGLLIHIFVHLSILLILLEQIRSFYSLRKAENLMLT